MPISHVSQVDTGQDKRRILVEAASELNEDIIHLNTLIDAYNASETFENLEAIEAAIRERDIKHSDAVVGKITDYIVNVHTRLVDELQSERARLQQAPLSMRSPEAFISNLPPKKMTRLTLSIMTGAPKRKDIYQKDEPGYKAFREFFKTYTLRRLGTGGNSRNFAVERNDGTGVECVLRFDNRYSVPRHIESYLRDQEGLRDVFIGVDAERRVRFLDKSGASQVRTVMITEYCPGSDLDEDSKKESDDEARLTKAISRYSEMASILTEMEAAGCVFIDLKNPNWLVDENGHLHIADTKGVYFTDNKGLYTKDDPKNRALGSCYHSAHATAPELFATRTCSAKSFHTYGLAKNLFQYVTQLPENQFYAEPDNPSNNDIKPVAELSFAHPVFQGERGQALERLIRDGLSEDPAKRPTASEFEVRLKQLEPAVFNALKPCAEALAKIESLGIGSHDTAMNEWLRSTSARLSSATTVDEVREIKREMRDVFTYLENNKPDIEKMRHVVADLENLGHRKDSQAVADAVGEVPLLERGNIGSASTKDTSALGTAKKYLVAGHKLRERLREESIEHSRELKQRLRSERDDASQQQRPEGGQGDDGTPRKDN